MTILTIAILIFCFFEFLNILLLYFAPGTTRGNGMGVFAAYEKSKSDPEIHALVSYLINWVAGTKLIFLVLLIAIVITGTPTTRLFAGIALVFSILTFYFRLYPAIRAMDKRGALTVKGYSRTLALMIGGFIIMFTAAVVVTLL